MKRPLSQYKESIVNCFWPLCNLPRMPSFIRFLSQSFFRSVEHKD